MAVGGSSRSGERAVLLGLACLLALIALDIVWMFAQQQQAHRRRDEAAEFQQLVGGLGMGPAADWSQCIYAFDPRLCDGCTFEPAIQPSRYFCPQHASSVFFMQPLMPRAHAAVKE